MNCFEDVTAVIFLAAISVFDQNMAEQADVSRMTDALDLFESIANTKFFENSLMILFLNKIDVLKEKLAVKKYSDYDKEYTGANTYEAVAKHITQKFVKRNRVPNRDLLVHYTCKLRLRLGATDTKQVAFILQNVNETIFEKMLKKMGLM